MAFGDTVGNSMCDRPGFTGSSASQNAGWPNQAGRSFSLLWVECL
jgi:hypothetical protein